jgi:hypothetical protein
MGMPGPSGPSSPPHTFPSDLERITMDRLLMGFFFLVLGGFAVANVSLSIAKWRVNTAEKQRREEGVKKEAHN